MNGLSAALGNLRAAGRRAGRGWNRGGKGRANRPLHVRDLRLEQLEDRTLLSIGGTLLTYPTSLIGPVPPVAATSPLSPAKVAGNNAVASSWQTVSNVLPVNVISAEAATSNHG